VSTAPATTPIAKAEAALRPARSIAPLYNALAAHLARTKAYPLACKAYFKAGMPAQHAVCLGAWADTGLVEEADLFIARAVFQALAAGDCEYARALFTTYRARYPASAESAAETPLAHCAEFFITACEVGSQQLYKGLTTAYAVALLRDPTFTELINKAAALYFGVQPKKSMLEMMLGGGAQ